MDIITLATIASAVGTMVSAIPPIVSGITKHRSTKIDDFKIYLNNLADCLDEMVEKLSKNEVPTKAGNRIEKAFESFEKKLENLRVEEAKKQDLLQSNDMLRRNLADGRFLDDVIGGNIRNAPPGEKVRALTAMTRTSGYLRGVADTLKS